MDVPGGTYRHWKGPEYLVLGLGHDADDAARTVVVYVPLYPVDGPPFAVREVSDFRAWVNPATGTVCGAGAPGAVQRFTRVR